MVQREKKSFLPLYLSRTCVRTYTMNSNLHQALTQCDVAGVLQYLRTDNCRSTGEGKWEECEPIDTLCMSDHIEDTPEAFLECARLLMRTGATTNTPSGALQLCMTRADDDTFAAFLKITTADPNHIGSTRHCSPHPPLLLALILRSAPKVQSLLEAGANPTLGELKGGSQLGAFAISPALPLHEAVAWGQWDIVQSVLAHGADPFQKDPLRNLTAVDWARHAANATTSPSAQKILQFFEDSEYAKKVHGERTPALHKELVEYVFHPSRLQKQGYFGFFK